jgi:hypothetical protein
VKLNTLGLGCWNRLPTGSAAERAVIRLSGAYTRSELRFFAVMSCARKRMPCLALATQRLIVRTCYFASASVCLCKIILLDVDALGLRLLLCLLFFSVAPPQPRQKHSATPFEDVGMRLAASRTLFISAANYSYGDFGGNTWATKVWRGWTHG